MIRSALRVVLAFAWVLAGVCAFAVVQARALAGPLESGTTVTITHWSGTDSAQDFYARFLRFAEDSGVVITREVADLAGGWSVRHLYVAARAGAEPVIADRQDFGGSVRTLVHPWRDLADRSPVGRYHVFGNPGDVHAVAKFLSGNRLTTETTQFGLRGLVPAAWYLPLLGLLILCAGLGGAGTVSAVRTTAVLRLHGWQRRRIWAAQLRDYLPWWVGSGVVMSGVSWLVLAAAGQSGRGLFLLAMTATATAALAAVVLAQVGVSVLMSTVGIPGALKGELPRWALPLATYSMRVTAAVIALSAAASTLTLAATLREVNQSRLAYDQARGWATAALGDVYTLADEDRLAARIGEWARSLDRDGHVLVSAPMRLQATNVGPRRDWLLVNGRYLREQRVVQASADPLTGPGDQVQVLIPDQLWEQRASIAGSLGLDVLLRDPAAAVSFIKGGAGQRLFTYAIPQPGTSNTVAVPSNTTDPVVVVLPELAALRDDAVAAFVSTGGVLFDGPATITASIVGDVELQRFVKAATPISSGVAGVITDLRSKLRLAVLGFLIAVLVVALSGYAAALVAVRRNSQLIFVRHVHGWRFSPTHRAGLAVEAVLLAVVVGWIPLHVWKARSQFEALVAAGAVPPLTTPAMSGGQWTAIVLLTVALCAGYLISLRQMHQQVITRSVAYR